MNYCEHRLKWGKWKFVLYFIAFSYFFRIFVVWSAVFRNMLIEASLLNWAFWHAAVFKGNRGEKKYQVNLRSHSAPIQVLLMNTDLCSRVPVVFPLPPTGNFSAMPTPPSTPASLQKFPLTMSACTTSSAFSFCYSQDSICSDHMMVLADHDEVLTPSSTPDEGQMGKNNGWTIAEFEWFGSTSGKKKKNLPHSSLHCAKFLKEMAAYSEFIDSYRKPTQLQ